MNVIPTAFAGLYVFEPRQFKDERGYFYESWREELYEASGIHATFLQDNVSVSRKNVLRGLHYQEDMGQLVTVSHGCIFDVAVDIRPHSTTYKHYFAINLSADSPQQVYMPPGFAHGFYVLSDIAVIHYKCTQYYAPEREGGLHWQDPSFDIRWPSQDPLLSPRDQRHPYLEVQKKHGT